MSDLDDQREAFGDFESDDPYERHLAHQAAKGRDLVRGTGAHAVTPASPDRPKRLSLSEIVALLLTRGGEHSNVRLSRNAKGDTQIEVVVRTGDDGIDTIGQAAERARQLYDELCSTYPMSQAGK